MRKEHSKSVKINIDKLREPETATSYKAELDRKITASNDNTPEESKPTRSMGQNSKSM